MARNRRSGFRWRPQWLPDETEVRHVPKPLPQFQPSNVLLVIIPPQFISADEASGASPQAALRGMAAMLCGLRCDESDRLVPLEIDAA